ncbi:MAG: hypothetical protein K2H41_08805 [Acetatifactor sp.]|nr:hypothetical protein [Acetatifactor sp.]MDE7113354.1 hypothetical protein [Acetatifactor sp.]
MELKEKLQKALQAVENGDAAAAGEAVSELKALPRTAEGVFDLKAVDEDVWKAAGLVYPVYVAYETVCNKKEGYPDLIAQMRAWDGMLKKDYTFANAAKAADMWIHTIQRMSPEIYEYYRELMDIFKANVRETLAKFYDTDAVRDAADAELFKAAVLQACASDILLAEKYEKRV